MLTSTNIEKVSAAFLAAQRKIDAVKKGIAHGHFKGKFYADINSVINSIKDIMNENGLTITQPINGNNVETYLLHESGQFIGSTTPIVCAKPNDPQALGSAITYSRRYGLQSLVGLPAEDDDGEAAMGRPSDSKNPPANTAPRKAAVAKNNNDF
jgi:hypothetical protein